MLGDHMKKTEPYSRVAFVSHTTELTGAVMSYYTLMTGLDDQTFQCLPVLPDDGPMYQQLQKDEREPSVIPFEGWKKLSSVSKAKRFLVGQKIDLVYLSCAQKFCRMVGKAASSLNIPIVWHVREPPLGNRVQKNIPYMKRFNASVVVVSKEQELALKSSLPVIKVDNGVDVSRFCSSIDSSEVREKYSISKFDFVFGIVGSIEKRKGTEKFLLAAKELSATHQNVKFLVVGSGKAEYLAKMKEIVTNSQSLKDKVTFTGNVWNIPEIMAALDVLVMPSSWEAFPRVVIEAMTMGKAVIASDVGDVSYIIDEGENGYVVPPNNLVKLTESMAFAIGNPGCVEDVASRAYVKAKATFTQEIHVEKMQKIFNKALSR